MRENTVEIEKSKSVTSPACGADVSSTHRFTELTEDGLLKHNPATCWWCQNPFAADEVAASFGTNGLGGIAMGLHSL